MLYVLLFSIATGMMAYAMITAIFVPFQVFLFYISRFKGRTILSINLYLLAIHGFFVASYRLTAGISGSTLQSFSIVFFLSVVILPKQQYLLLTLVNMGTVAILLVAEYNDPTFILTNYQGKKEHFVDIASTYAVTIILMLIGLGYLIKQYTLAKDSAEKRALMLDELHEEKAQLLAVISHDYHTPLAALQHYLSVLEKAELSAQQRQAFTAQMRQTVLDTQSLLANLLDMSRQSVGQDEHITQTAFSVLEAVSGTLQVYTNIALSNRQQINISIPENLFIVGDKNLFTVIIRNLINNAIKFSGDGATVRFFYEAINGIHVFVVSDNGPGIGEKQQREIVEIWQHPARNMSRSGAIGLALSNKCALALGGTLDFETSTEIGTKFILKIPAIR
jgi:signal transduction histidine kinase